MHTWEIKRYHPFQLLPPSVWKMCAGASQQCEITPLGGQRKGSQPKNVTWIPLNVPSFVMTRLHSTGTTYRNVVFFAVHYKLLLLMLFFVVMLRNNLVAFGIVLPRILVRALSAANNLAASEIALSATLYIYLYSEFILFSFNLNRYVKGK